MNEELQAILKCLRLWSLLANWDDLLARKEAAGLEAVGEQPAGL